MPYTRGWNDSTPAGTRAANQIDDAIQEFKVDLHERMDSTFAVDWTADPVVAKPALLGLVDNRVMIFGPHIFLAHEDQDDVGRTDAYVEHDSDTSFMAASPYIPHGITIQKLELIGNKNGSTNIVVSLRKVEYLTGVATVIDTATRSVANLGVTVGTTSALGDLAEVVDVNTYHYVFRLTGSTGLGNVRLYGVRLTVDVPNHLSAV